MQKRCELNVRGSNRLLSSLQPKSRTSILSRAHKVEVRLRQVLMRAHAAITHVYLPLHGVISLTIMFEEGVVVEAATVGNEGLVGLPVLLANGESAVDAVCQVPAVCLRIRTEDFLEEIERTPRLREVAFHYASGFLHHVTQVAACNRVHPVEQRLCRRLLMTHDRVGADHLPLTHEFLGQMLGIRRASVSKVVAVLERAGYVRHRRGSIEILDRAALEERSCGCYLAIQHEYERLLC